MIASTLAGTQSSFSWDFSINVIGCWAHLPMWPGDRMYFPTLCLRLLLEFFSSYWHFVILYKALEPVVAVHHGGRGDGNSLLAKEKSASGPQMYEELPLTSQSVFKHWKVKVKLLKQFEVPIFIKTLRAAAFPVFKPNFKERRAIHQSQLKWESLSC